MILINESITTTKTKGIVSIVDMGNGKTKEVDDAKGHLKAAIVGNM